jgi:RNA polymerase sigma-70 factor (ECF subfamily)
MKPTQMRRHPAEFHRLRTEASSRPLRDHPEEQVTAMAQSGSQDAFGELVYRNHARSSQIAHSIIPNPAVVEDVVSQSFYKALIHLDQFVHRSSFSSWFNRIVINECYQWLRSSHWHEHISVDDQEASPEKAEIASRDADPETRASSDQLTRLLLQEISRIPVHLREPLMMQLHLHSLEEIARSLGISEAAVKSRVYRAKDH